MAGLRNLARFSVMVDVFSLRVRVLPDATQMRVLWRQLGGAPVRPSEYLHGLFIPARRAPLGTIALSHADLTIEIVSHEAVHAAVHAVQLLRKAPQLDDHVTEERIAELTGLITCRVVRGLAARGIGCA